MKELSDIEIKDREVFLLAKLDKLCRENSIDYTISYGTLLGAVRHKGFIPWDDDIDIMVKRQDYNKLRDLIVSKKDCGFDFIDIDTNPKAIYPFGKISDKETLLIEKNFRTDFDMGLFIDVFPLDNMPDNPFVNKIFRNINILKVRFLTHSARSGYEKTDSLKTNFLRFLAFKLGHMINLQKAIRKFYQSSQKYNHKKTNMIGLSWGNYSFFKEDFDEIVDIDFENIRVMAPKACDRILKLIYGNYMKLPDGKARVSNHGFKVYWKD